MSLATETSTAEEKTVYSVCGLLQFSKHYAGQLIVPVLFLLLAFGQKLFSNTFSIDTQGMVVPDVLRTLVFARPCGDGQFAAGTFSPSLDMSR